MRRILLTLFALVLIAAASAAVVGYRAHQWLDAPLPKLSASVVYEVPSGTSLTGIAGDLYAKGILEHPKIFALWARLTQQTRGIKAGEYELLPGLSPRAL